MTQADIATITFAVVTARECRLSESDVKRVVDFVVPVVTQADIATITFPVVTARECRLSESDVKRAVDFVAEVLTTVLMIRRGVV